MNRSPKNAMIGRFGGSIICASFILTMNATSSAQPAAPTAARAAGHPAAGVTPPKGNRNTLTSESAHQTRPQNNASNGTLRLQVQTLTDRLERLTAEMATLRRSIDSRPEVQRHIDQLEATMRQLREDLAGLRTRQADMERRPRLLQPNPTSTTGWRFGYHNGPWFQAQHNRFRLHFKGFSVMGYRMDAVAANSSSSEDVVASGRLTNKFQVKNARLGADGFILSRRFRYDVTLETASSAWINKVHLKKATISFLVPGDWLTITLGQQKTPDSFQELRSSAHLQLLDRSPATESFAQGYDVGLTMNFSEWRHRLVQQIGLFNGEGANPDSVDTNFIYVLRLGIQPMGPLPHSEDDLTRSSHPKLWIGTSFVLTPHPSMTDNSTHARVYRPSAELAFLWKGFNLQSEFFYRIVQHAKDSSTGKDSATKKYAGVYAQTGYIFNHDIQIAARYTAMQIFPTPNMNWSNPGASGWSWTPTALHFTDDIVDTASYQPPTWIHKVTAAVMVDFWEHHLRLALIYSWEKDDDLTIVENTAPYGDAHVSYQVHTVRLLARLAL